MKKMNITVYGDIKGQTAYPTYNDGEKKGKVISFDIEVKEGAAKATKQLAHALKFLCDWLAGYRVTNSRFVLTGNGKTQKVTGTTILKGATQSVLLNLAKLAFSENDFGSKGIKIKSPMLEDIANTFGVKDTANGVSHIQYQTAIQHRFGILNKVEKMQKVETLQAVTTTADVQVKEAYTLMFPAKPKAIAAPAEAKPTREARKNGNTGMAAKKNKETRANRKPAELVETPAASETVTEKA